MKTCKIYALLDPDTLEVRYIGKTNQKLKSRIFYHMKEAKDDTIITYKTNWLRTLIKKDKKPVVIVLEECEENEWQELEKYYIKYFRNIQDNLTNTCAGGFGGGDSYERSKKTRKKTSDSLKKAYKEGRKKISKEHKEMLRERMANRIVSDETKEKIRKALTGTKVSEATKLKKSKTVYQYDKLGNFIRSFQSVTKAAKAINGYKGNIHNAITGKNQMKTYKGFIWKYEKI